MPHTIRCTGLRSQPCLFSHTFSKLCSSGISHSQQREFHCVSFHGFHCSQNKKREASDMSQPGPLPLVREGLERGNRTQEHACHLLRCPVGPVLHTSEPTGNSRTSRQLAPECLLCQLTLEATHCMFTWEFNSIFACTPGSAGACTLHSQTPGDRTAERQAPYALLPNTDPVPAEPALPRP